MALYHSSLRWFEASTCMAASRGPPSSSIKHGLKFPSSPSWHTPTTNNVCKKTSQSRETGTSTGGIAHAFPGKVGDTPITGAGTFASRSAGASATGPGEGILRVGGGQAVQEACDRVVEICSERGFPCRVIALDDEGNAGLSHNGFFVRTMHSRFD